MQNALLLFFLLCVVQSAQAEEAKPDREKCLQMAFLPYNNVDGKYLKNGVLMWQDKGAVKASTESGTVTLNGGNCNFSPTPDIYDAVGIALTAIFDQDNNTIEKNNSSPLRRWLTSHFNKNAEQKMRDRLHACEGISPKLDKVIGELWQQYGDTIDSPATNKAGK